MHQAFAENAKIVLASDENIIGLAVAGSWITHELDAFSDLDLILVTQQSISSNKKLMLDYAKKLGDLLSGFTGEHVGEPRLLICLYDNPLLHVDIKFLDLEEFRSRVENPMLLIDKDRQLANVLQTSNAKFPYPDYQWIEDRFWTWVHYALLKIGRGEYLEALDFMGYLRMVVLGPLLQIKNHQLPRGVRKVETALEKEDLARLTLTIPHYNRASLIQSLRHAVSLYRELRKELFDHTVSLNLSEHQVMVYFEEIAKGNE